MAFIKTGELNKNQLDLNKILVKNPTATFFVKISGDNLNDHGIYSDDILIVDRSIKPQNGFMAVLIIDGQFVVKPIEHLENINNSESDDLIWGVVRSVIHNFL